MVLFPDFHVVVTFFYSSEFMCRVLFNFLWALKVTFLISPPHTFVTHDETNQAKCNKSINEQTETN